MLTPILKRFWAAIVLSAVLVAPQAMAERSGSISGVVSASAPAYLTGSAWPGQPWRLYTSFSRTLAQPDLKALDAASAAQPADTQPVPTASPTVPPSSSSAPASSSPAAAPPPSTAPPPAAPEFWLMAPIPNPEDMPAAERHRIYGARFDHVSHAHHTRSHHHRARHHHHHHHHHRHHHTGRVAKATATRTHARYGEKLASGAGATGASKLAESHAKAAAAHTAPTLKTAAAQTAPAKAPAPKPVAVSSAPPVAVATAQPASAPASHGGKTAAAVLALFLGAFVIFMALRQTMANRRHPPMRNYEAPRADPPAPPPAPAAAPRAPAASKTNGRKRATNGTRRKKVG